MSDQHSALARLVEDIETLRARVDELERRATAVLEEANSKITTSDRTQADTPGKN